MTITITIRRAAYLIPVNNIYILYTPPDAEAAAPVPVNNIYILYTPPDAEAAAAGDGSEYAKHYDNAGDKDRCGKRTQERSNEP